MTKRAGIQVCGLSFTYPGSQRPVLDRLEFEVAAGERVALLGPNGSGKTTLALHLNGLLTAQTGTIAFEGLTLAPGTLTQVRRRVGLVFQDPNDQLFMHSVRDDVAFGPANLGFDMTEIEERVDMALGAVSATHLADSAPHHLSGGEKRRTAIATVLSMDPEILVLDEPTSGLDPLGRHELADLLNGLPQTQFIITHDLPFALATCTRALVLDDARIAVDMATESLLADPDLLAKHRLALPFGYRDPWSG